MDLTVGSARTVAPFVLLSGRIGLAGDSDAAVGGIRQRRLLGGLASRRGLIVTADWLADVVWYGAEPPDAAPSTIRTYVYRLRKALEGNSSGVQLETIGGSYRLECPDGAVDLDAFMERAALAQAADGAGHPEDAIVAVERAIELWKGEPYGELAGESWAIGEASRLVELHNVVKERRASSLISLNRVDEAVAELEGLVRAEPLREARVDLLARALVRSSRQGDALREIAQLRQRLRDELGLDPSAMITELEQRILSDEESLSRVPAMRTVRSFELTERVRSGDGWSSWLGRHPSLNHDIRLDTFDAGVADDPRFVRNFERCLRQLSRLEHPAIVPVEDYWREPGSAHVVTRVMQGPSLAECLTGEETVDLRLDDVAEQIGGALATAHREGVVHGQLGADSVVSDRSGNWYLTDFANVEAIVGDVSADDDLDELVTLLRSVAQASGSADDVVPDVSGEGVDALLAEFRRLNRPTLRAPSIDGQHRLGRNPYPGLRAFDDSEQRLFFGRTELTERVLEELDESTRMKVIIGPSGTGKSSLLHASVLPAMIDAAAGGLLVARMTPGNDPFDRLSAALESITTTDSAVQLSASRLRDEGVVATLRRLVDGDTEMVVAVDQLEELFTLSSEGDSDSFLAQLYSAATEPGLPVWVLATVRSDHFGGLLTIEPMAKNLTQMLVPVPPFTADQLQMVITGPAHLAGVDVEARLVSTLVGQLTDRPSLLPHLQHTLRQLFDDRDGRVLTYRSYETAGGVTGALGRTGERVYERLSADEALALRRVFRRLSHIEPDGEVTRRRAVRSTLASTPQTERVLSLLGEERLVVFDHDPQTRAPTVEITHESIFRAWPRLADWLREDAEVAQLLEDLDERSRTWVQLDREPGELLHGIRLDQALEALPTIEDELSERELDYVDASRVAREEARARDARRRKRLRLSLVAALVGLVVSAAVGVYALDQRSDAEVAADSAAEAAAAAEQSRDEAEAQAAMADQQRALADQRLMLGSARLLLDQNPRTGVLLAAQLHEQDPSFETRSLLQEALVSLPRGFEQFYGADVAYSHVSLSADAAMIAGLSPTHLEVWEAETGAELVRHPAPGARDVAVTNTHTYLVDNLGSLSRIELASGSIEDLEAPFEVNTMMLTEARLVIGGADGGVAHVPTGGDWEEFPRGMSVPIDRVHVDDASGFLVATSLQSGSPAVVFNVDSGEFVGVHGHRGGHGLQHTRDAIVAGASLVSMGPDGSLQIRSLPELELQQSVNFVGRRLEAIDDERVLVAGESGWLSVRSLETAGELERFDGTATQRTAEVAIGAGGSMVAMATPAGVERWSLEGGRALAETSVLDGDLAEFDMDFSERSPGGLYPANRVDLTNPGLVIFKDGAATDLWAQTGLPLAMSMRILGDMGAVFLSDFSVRFVEFDGDRITPLPDVGLNGLNAADGWAIARHGETIAIVTGRADDTRVAIVERTGPGELELVRTLPTSALFGGAWFSTDGRYLTVGDNRTSTTWDTKSWDVVGQFDDFFDWRVVGRTDIGPDETLLLDVDGNVRWASISTLDVRETKQLSTAGFPILLFSYLLAPDLLLTGAPGEIGGSARLWDLEHGAQLGVTFPLAGDGSWRHSEDQLMTIEGRSAHIWPLDPDTWGDHACRIAGRSLTTNEWDEHGPTGAEFDPACG